MVIGIIGISIAFIFMLWVRWAFQGSKVDLLQFDVSTITAGDYTVEIKFDTKDYNHWFQNVYEKSEDKKRGVSPAIALKKNLSEEIIAIVQKERARQDGKYAKGQSGEAQTGDEDKDEKRKRKDDIKQKRLEEMKKKVEEMKSGLTEA